MSPFFESPKIAAGPEALGVLSGLGARRAAIVADPGLVPFGWPDRLRRIFAASDTETEARAWDGGEPTVAGVEALAERFRAFGPEWIVALGGGRTLEAAKAAWVRYADPQRPLDALTPLDELHLRERARFVAVPSTSGSGAESGWTALVRRPDGSAIEVASRELVADWALLDPRLPASLSPAATAETGAELIVQAIEALLTEWANPFSDALAREALALAFPALPKAVRHPDDAEARADLHHAASLAGLAASNAQLGAAHALASALAPEAPVPHGRLLGVLMPYVAEFNYPAARDRLARSEGVLGGGAGKDRSAVAARLRALFGPLGIPKTLAEAGVPPEVLTDRRAAVVARARAAIATPANPRVPSEAEYARLLAAAYDGVAVMF